MLLLAIALICAVVVSEGVASAHQMPRNDPQRGLIYDGLERVTSGPCARLFRLKRSGGCTHGPDPAPAGANVAADAVPLAFAAGGSPRVQCDGDGSGGARVQVLYAHASDVTDRFDTFANSFRQWAADADRIIRNSATDTGGERHIRFVTDTNDCRVKVVKVTIDPADDDTLDATIAALQARGWNSPNRKYLVFVDANVLCGQGGVDDDAADSQTNRNNSGPDYSRVDAGCWGGTVAAHELGHNLGAVQKSAPNSSGGWHCTDENDVMCYADAPGVTLTFPCNAPGRELMLDCNHDDYFHTGPPAGSYLDTNWNVADNKFLTWLPQSLWAYVWGGTSPITGRTHAHAAWQRNSTGALNVVERTGTGAYTITFRNLGVFPIARNGGGGTVHVTAHGNGPDWCNVRRWQPTPSALDGDLQVDVRCYTAAGTPVDTQFAAMFARPFTYDQPRFGYVNADQPAAASYTPSTAYSYNGMGAASTNTITRTATGRYQVRFPGLGGSTSAAAQITAAGPNAETCRATGWQTSANGLDELVDVACHTSAGGAVDAPFTLSFHERDGMLGVLPHTGSPRAYVVSDQQNVAIHTPTAQYNSSGGQNRISHVSTGVYRVRLSDLASAGGHVQVASYLPAADSRRCKVASWGADGADEVVTVRCFDASGTVADARFVMSFAV
jgi:hypothetical protein